jgi:hypothetical protein
VGRRVVAGRLVGEVDAVSPDGRQFWLVNERSGARQNATSIAPIPGPCRTSP